MSIPPIETIERAGLSCWPGLETDWDGSWVRRAAGGYTKRANSLQCFDRGDGLDVAARLAAGQFWFEKRCLTPVVRSTPLQAPELTTLLDHEGWETIDRSYLFAMVLGEHEPDGEACTLPLLDENFLSIQQRLQGYSEDQKSKLAALLKAMAVPATGIVVYRDGVPVASGLMAIAEGIVITGNVVTDAEHRRQGLGAAIMQTGLHWARELGATVAALNVAAENTAAQALYHGLGFVHQYDYHYRIPGRPA